MTTDTRDRSIGLVVAIGIGAGFLSGMFGVGGGILVVPALVLLLKFDQRLANGTSLGAVLPISISSLVTYWSHDNVDWHMALWLAIGALGGALLGTRWIHVLPRRVLGYLFALMLVATAVRLFIPMSADGRDVITVVAAVALVLIGLVTGTLAGLLGIGGGVVMVPAMVVFFSELNVVAKGTSVAVIIPTSIMGTWRNWKADNVDLRVAGIVGVAGIVSAIGGGIIADHMSQDLSNILFASLVLVVAMRMIFDLRRDSTN
ncbi:MAG: sulfite exporter TauE/SafE family protein [Actinobacteria bacterium]|nr:sulfite exporter TauE/SafE family protein [Actinomycetota bacterium]NDA76271.1 sulfite exporter TauE/SafE family protein [Actinomycetota bacterium]NDB06478.1 sulfite exporter TauE/SafE family protein [Acidimicrobiia bacterium]